MPEAGLPAAPLPLEPKWTKEPKRAQGFDETHKTFDESHKKCVHVKDVAEGGLTHPSKGYDEKV